MARTKIVATIGPATGNAQRIEALLDAGMNVARLNCAHADHESLGRWVRTLREQAARRGIPLAILADLSGPKLRVGRMHGGGVELVSGRPFVLTTEEIEGSDERASVNYAGLPGDVKPGDSVYLNDGLIRLIVTGTAGPEVHTRVAVGGWLRDLKGLSVPSAEIGTPALTDKDWLDLDFLVAAGVDYIGLSFVRSAADVSLLRAGLRERGAAAAVVAKIEKAQAVERLDSIVGSSDAVMVARGDLGVECPIEDVPVLQKRIIRTCNAAGVPVITATQMLESMVDNPRPTRAEASDVANAVLDGTDAVMLSAETAVGQFPAEAVRVMSRIIENSERFARRDARSDPASAGQTLSVGDAIARSACLAADAIGAQSIICLTQSGATARYLSKWRPRQPILGVTPHISSWNKMALLRGVEAILISEFDMDFDQACARVVAALRADGRVRPGRPVLITAGLPFAERGRTNTMRIADV